MKNYNVKQHEYGFYHLDPIPDEGEIQKFYRDKYYKDIRNGNGNPDHLNRCVAGGDEGDREREWLHNTLYCDLKYVINEFSPGDRVLDIGCGTGEFIKYMKSFGMDAIGIEPSTDATNIALESGLNVTNMVLSDYVLENNDKFDATVLINIVEHVVDPIDTILLSKKITVDGGIVCVIVPNDFSELQRSAQKFTDNYNNWWVSFPDHINYFNVQTLENTMEKCGMKVVYKQCDFPMEMFILMGKDYVKYPHLGKECHNSRVEFEAAISEELRRNMCKAYADVGIGRACMIVGRKEK